MRLPRLSSAREQRKQRQPKPGITVCSQGKLVFSEYRRTKQKLQLRDLERCALGSLLWKSQFTERIGPLRAIWHETIVGRPDAYGLHRAKLLVDGGCRYLWLLRVLAAPRSLCRKRSLQQLALAEPRHILQRLSKLQSVFVFDVRYRQVAVQLDEVSTARLCSVSSSGVVRPVSILDNAHQNAHDLHHRL